LFTHHRILTARKEDIFATGIDRAYFYDAIPAPISKREKTNKCLLHTWKKTNWIEANGCCACGILADHNPYVWIASVLPEDSPGTVLHFCLGTGNAFSMSEGTRL
jgi:hypothetical protein